MKKGYKYPFLVLINLVYAKNLKAIMLCSFFCF